MKANAGTLALGALAGAAAVFLMDRIDYAIQGQETDAQRDAAKKASGGREPPPQGIATQIERAAGANLDEDQHGWAGTAVHYALGIAPAMVYAALRPGTPWLGTARGALFGAGLWLLLDEGVNTATGLSGDPRDYPWPEHARGLVSHIVYGFVLDWMVVRGFGLDFGHERKRSVYSRDASS